MTLSVSGKDIVFESDFWLVRLIFFFFLKVQSDILNFCWVGSWVMGHGKTIFCKKTSTFKLILIISVKQTKIRLSW